MYIIINILLFLAFCFLGRKVVSSQNYSFYSVIFILLFSFVLGSRYDRGVDYFRYVHTFLYDDDLSQFVFTWLNQLLRFIGFNQYSFLYVYSLIFIFCAVILFKRFQIYSNYLFPLFLMSFSLFVENNIRQALSYSFIFIFVYYLFLLDDFLKNNAITLKTVFVNSRIFVVLLLVSLISYGIHSVSIATIFIIFVLFFLKNPITLKLSIPILIFCSFFIKYFFDWSWINSIFLFLGSQDELIESYVSRADTFFSDDANNLFDWYRNPIIKGLEFLGHLSLFILGFRIIKDKFANHRIVITLYNCFVIGSFLLQTFWNNELMRRFSENLHYLYIFPLSIVLYHKKEYVSSKLLRYLYFFLIFWVWDYFRYVFMKGDAVLFLWD